MQAIILAAGMGRRLGEFTQENTKCMVPVNGITLIDRTMDILARFSLKRIVLVIGYKGERLRKHVGELYQGIPVCYVTNPVYDKTNNIYSLYLAKNFLQEEDTLLLESDLIFDSAILDRMIKDPYPNLVAVAKYESWMDGTVVNVDESGKIQSFIPKDAFQFDKQDSYYKTLNVYKFKRDFLNQHYIPFLEAYSKALGNNSYYEEVLRIITLIDKVELKALPVNGEKWYEIDDVQDLDIAETLFATSNDLLDKYQKRYGGYWRFPKLLDFCYLVNPFFPPQKMIEEITTNFSKLLTEYPSGMFVNTLLAAKYFGIRHDFICVGNGAAELIRSLMTYTDGKIGVIYPTFEEYPNRKREKSIVAYIPENKDFTYSVSDVKNFFGEKSIETLLLINPGNPSGYFLKKNDIINLLEWAGEMKIRIVVDESFVDFSCGYEHNTLLENSIMEKYPHLIVVKSISKSYGVPGLRLGILASSDRTVIDWIKRDVPIWNINSFAEFYMQIFSKYESFYKEACRLFVLERERFFKELSQISFIRVIPSEANYFLCEVIDLYSARQLTQLLLERYNILIKDCSGKVGFSSSQYVRIAIRNNTDNDKLVNVLKDLLS